MPRLSVRATISALPFAIKKEAQNEVWRGYVADALKVISENTAAFSEGGKCMSVRFDDIIRPDAKKTENQKSGDEIADDVISLIAKREVKNE